MNAWWDRPERIQETFAPLRRRNPLRPPTRRVHGLRHHPSSTPPSSGSKKARGKSLEELLATEAIDDLVSSLMGCFHRESVARYNYMYNQVSTSNHQVSTRKLASCLNWICHSRNSTRRLKSLDSSLPTHVCEEGTVVIDVSGTQTKIRLTAYKDSSPEEREQPGTTSRRSKKRSESRCGRKG